MVLCMLMLWVMFVQALARRREGLGEVWQLTAEAWKAQDLMRPVAARKTTKSAAEVSAVLRAAILNVTCGF